MIRLAWLLSLGVGFLSLSQEIVWVRLVGFVYHGVPQSFAVVLVLFLLGIALGASVGRRLCDGRRGGVLAAGLALLASGVLDILLPGLLAGLAEVLEPLRFLMLAVLIATTAALKAAVFPIAHHLGSSGAGRKLGRSLSRVYFLNIVGSTAGPLITGLVLLDWLTPEATLTAIGLAAIGLSMVCLLAADRRWMAAFAAAAGLAGGAFLFDPQDTGAIEAFAERGSGGAIKKIVHNRHGLLHVVDGGPGGDIVFGGNVYDGRINVDLAVNSNRIDRMYLLSALHPAPEQVLVIGMSTGAWLRVLSAMPAVRHIDIVEINPGYVDLIEALVPPAGWLSDSRFSLYIDDGRRWLNRHPQQRYDLIVMNTTFHWRANITNLLSRQFMAIAKAHMAPGAIIAFNATGSPDALATAAAVFGYAYQWSNFVYAGAHDFRALDHDAARRRLESMVLDGSPLIVPDSAAHRDAVARLLEQPFADLSEVQAAAGRPLEVIDDMAMQTEFRYGRGLRLE